MPPKQEIKPFDLNTLSTAKAAEEGAVLDVLHPTENVPVGIRITLAGIDSKVYRKVVNKMNNDRVKKMNPGQPNSLLQTAEEKEINDLTILTSCTLNWASGESKNSIYINGEYLPCIPENVRKIYADPGFSWLREQVDRFIADRAHFLAS